MKRKKTLNMMDSIDNDLIDRASPNNIKPIKRSFSKKIGLLAACIAVAVLAVNLAVFLPMGKDDDSFIAGDKQPTVNDSLSHLIHDSYSDIKDIIDENSYPLYDNDMSEGPSFPPPGANPPSGGNADRPNDVGGSVSGESSGSGYVEVTDNQVDGVIEADLFKRTASHIFYLREHGIYAYSIDKENSKLVGEYIFTDDFVIINKEMYLSDDGKTATVIYSTSSGTPTVETKVLFIDVSNPERMKTVKRTSFKGRYKSSRYTNNELLLFTSFTVENTNKTENYIPSVDTGKGFELLEPSCIIAPQDPSNTTYLVVSKLNGDTLGFNGSVALLGYSGAMYVSQNNVYATRSIYQSSNRDNVYTYANNSEIISISHKNDIINVSGAITVAGTIKDQYCMDEKDGILRVFTTTNDGYYTIYTDQNGSSGSSSGSASGGTVETANPGTIDSTPAPSYPDDTSSSTDTVTSSTDAWASSEAQDITPQSNDVRVSKMSYTKSSGNNRSASLYCINVSKMKVIASVENFAPQGESVQSARFDGDTAYVCTAIVFTDPVFVFDLSDLSNITYKDTGNIEGYSHSLVELKDGYLLGIGQTGWTTIKLELYKEEGSELISVSKVELPMSTGTEEYKAHYINREEMVFGFAYSYWNYNEPRAYYYDIYKIVDGEITLANRVEISPCWEKNCRGALIDDYFYILTDATEKNTVFEDNFYFVPIN